jgi:two-component system NtrC family sensor kinase
MTIRFQLILLLIAVVLAINSILSLVGVRYVDAVWMREIQDRVRVSLDFAQASYDNHEQRMVSFLQAASLDQTLSAAISQRGVASVRQAMDRVYAAGHLDFVTLLEQDARVRYRPANPSVGGDRLDGVSLVSLAVLSGEPRSGTIILSATELAAENPSLVARAAFELQPTAEARPTRDQVRTDAMCLAAVVPIFDEDQQLVGLLFGGYMLNRRNEVVDRIRDEVFLGGAVQDEDLGTVTIFQGDLRVATNVRDDTAQRATGTRLSAPVYQRVLTEGKVWSAPAFVVNQWYLTAYKPIEDPRGQVIGALYVGLRRAPFAHQRNTIVAVFLAAIFVVSVITLLVLWLVTNWVLRPIGRVLDMCKGVIQGDLTARVGIRPPGEFGLLCQALDDMAESIERREQQIDRMTKQQIGRSEKLASIGRLAAGIAHEINNPLTGVLTFAHLIRDRQDAESQDREDVELVIQETQRAAEVVQGLLDFARERPVAKVQLDVNAVIQRMVRLVENQKEMRRVHIEQEYAEDLPDILGDANQLQQVLLNLFLNAAAAMPQGGTLNVTTRVDDSDVTIVVADDGCGIEREHLDQIFDPFFTTKPVGQGTGLGLSVSYGIIEQHGGSIEVDSEPGRGSTFTIRLPIIVDGAAGILEQSEAE